MFIHPNHNQRPPSAHQLAEATVVQYVHKKDLMDQDPKLLIHCLSKFHWLLSVTARRKCYTTEDSYLLVLYWYYVYYGYDMSARLLVVVAGAVAGHGHGGEPARARPESAHAPPVLRLLCGGRGANRRRERPARPLAALHGADPHQRAAHPPARARAQPAARRARAARGRRGGRLVFVSVSGVGRLAFLVEAAAERARVVRRRAHAGPPAPCAAGRRRGRSGNADRLAGR